MSRKGFVRNFKPLEILTDEQMESIKRGTLHVLEETGVRIEHKKALEFLKKHDCKVDHNEMRVRIPSGLVEECISRCPSKLLIKARDSQNDVFVGGNVLYFKNSSGMQIIDLDTYEPRIPTRKENYDAVTVLDSLENLDLLGPYTPYFGFEGIPRAMSIPESCASRFRGSTKALVGGCLNDSEIFTIEMAKATGAEILHVAAASPPLTWYSQPIEVIFRITEAGFPLRVAGGQMFGGTAPATLSGALVTNNAEIMVAIVLAQLLKPGTRVLVDDFVFPLNMKSGSPAFGAIGISLHQVAFNQIWRRYGLPTCNASCGYISSKRIDFQSGYEKAVPALLSAISGTGYVGMHGSISAELTFHPLQAIIDDDLAGMIGRFLSGILVNDETLASGG